MTDNGLVLFYMRHIATFDDRACVLLNVCVVLSNMVAVLILVCLFVMRRLLSRLIVVVVFICLIEL